MSILIYYRSKGYIYVFVSIAYLVATGAKRWPVGDHTPVMNEWSPGESEGYVADALLPNHAPQMTDDRGEGHVVNEFHKNEVFFLSSKNRLYANCFGIQLAFSMIYC